ncbi:MAG TPA: ribose-5-phosphate isomerase RpiA [Chlamydiales bacterium]|nr:ribose-5-phosphate isomerase RpiA [Chlamydiales bacterium]
MNETGKKAAGVQAANLIEDGMVVGLGTGSTTAYFIQALIEKRLRIKTVASSKRSHEIAKAGGLHVLDINEVDHIDMTVDGTDEIDPQKRLIKGGGGALVREKILALSSSEMVVIADVSKVVTQLGKAKLPVEILPYGHLFARKKIEHLGYSSTWRIADPTSLNQEQYVSDNGNYILDIHFPTLLKNPEEVNQIILEIPGVVDTGFFFKIAKRAIIGRNDGTTFNI